MSAQTALLMISSSRGAFDDHSLRRRLLWLAIEKTGSTRRLEGEDDSDRPWTVDSGPGNSFGPIENMVQSIPTGNRSLGGGQPPCIWICATCATFAPSLSLDT